MYIPTADVETLDAGLTRLEAIPLHPALIWWGYFFRTYKTHSIVLPRYFSASKFTNLSVHVEDSLAIHTVNSSTQTFLTYLRTVKTLYHLRIINTILTIYGL